MVNTIETDILYIVIYIIILCCILTTHQRQIFHRLGVGSIIILSYIIYPIIGAFWFFSPIPTYGETEPLKLLPFIYLAMMFWIALRPIFQYDQLDIKQVEPPSMILFYTFTIIYTIAALMLLPESFKSISQGLQDLLIDDRAGEYMYENSHGGGDTSFNFGITNLFAIFFNIFSPIIYIFFFYYLTLKVRHMWVIISLGTCIITQTVSSLSTGGRTMATMCIFNIIGAYMLFRPMLSTKMKYIVHTLLVIFAFTISIPFVALTYSRFGHRQGGVAENLFYYIGEAPYYFNNYAFEAEGERHGDRTCNYFKEFLGLHPPYGVQGVRDAYPNIKLNDSIFSSFVGDFVVDFGIIHTFILFSIFSILFCRLTRNNAPNQIPFYRLILVFFATSVCLQGGMYLFTYAFAGNLTILAILFTYIIFGADYYYRHHKN